MGGKALRAAIMSLLASLIKDIIRNLINWLRSSKRKLSTFLDSVKSAITSFFSDIKAKLLNAGESMGTSIATAIFGPVIGVIKKAWIFLKQGYKSIKDAIKFLKDPANANMPFSLKMMQVGKIIIVGLTAGGAIVLSEVIEKALMTFPVFAFEIPLIGSLANIIGMFLGALVSGLIGALALNLIDRLIAKKLKRINEENQSDKRNEIIKTQNQLTDVKTVKSLFTIEKTQDNIQKRHNDAALLMQSSLKQIARNSEDINKLVEEDIDSNLDIIFDDINKL